VASELQKRTVTKILIIIGMAVVAGLSIGFQKFRLGLDLQGGTELLYRIRHQEVDPEDLPNLTQNTIDAIRRRVDPQGIMELDIRQRGRFRFYIQLPRISHDEAGRIEKRMQQMGKLQFSLVSGDSEARERALDGQPVRIGRERYIPYILRKAKEGEKERERFFRSTVRELARLQPAEEDWLLVKEHPDVTGDDLDTRKIHPTSDDRQMPAVGFEFKGRGRVQFARVTERHKGEELAIILDNVLYSHPVIRDRIAGAGVISGDFTTREQHDLIVILQAGQLPADIELEWKHAVGPELGEDSIHAGVRATIIGLVLVVLAVAIYYLGTGLVANFTLFLNLLFIMGAVSLLQAVLTLPGIAGLILTVGMAVDANVLIFERIREEKARGKTARLAMKNGFDRAFRTIVDANLTTLITALILFGVGTGPVRGFATILSIGIVSSVFCALYVTRAILELLLGANVIKEFHMFRLFKRPHIAFSSVRYPVMLLSLAAIAGGLAVFTSRGNRKYDNDLTGGFMAQMALSSEMSVAEFRRRVQEAGYEGADIQSLARTAEEQKRGESKDFTIRVKKPPRESLEQKVRADVRAAFAAAGLTIEVEPVADQVYRYRVALAPGAREISETAVRALLRKAGYRDGDIRFIVFESTPARSYELIILPGRLDKEKVVRLIKDIRETLADWVVTRKTPYTTTPVRPVKDIKDIGARTTWVTELTFEEAAPREAIREALIRNVLVRRPESYFSVRGSGTDARSDIVRQVKVEAAGRALLDKITAAAGKPLEIVSFLEDKSRIRFELNEPRLELALRERLAEGDILTHVRSLVPQEAVGKVLLMQLGFRREGEDEIVLRDDKVLEMIESDLMKAFANEIAQEKVGVAFAPAEAPDFIDEPEVLKDEGYRFVALRIEGTGMSVQAIRRNLVRAGLGEALLLSRPANEVATETRTEVTLKIKGDEEALGTAQKAIAEEFATPRPFHRLESIGPTVAGEMKSRAYAAMVISLVAVVFYIWLRFGELKFGIAAIIALAHDVLMTMGAVAVADWLSDSSVGQMLGFSNIKINLQMIAAFLTIVGYSLNDTIVVFDRIRENLGGGHKRIEPRLIDASINQTLSRTLLTSLTTLIVCLCLYFLGGPVIHGFAFALTFGVVVGTYSSIFIASPILIDWNTVVGRLSGRRRAAGK